MAGSIAQTTELRLYRVRFESPGFLSLVGVDRVLKVIADFFVGLRHDATTQENNRMVAEVERFRTEVELKKALLSAMPEMAPYQQDAALAYVLDKPLSRIRNVARDVRISEVSTRPLLQEPSQAAVKAPQPGR
jgi:hypothetical protein